MGDYFITWIVCTTECMMYHEFNEIFKLIENDMQSEKKKGLKNWELIFIDTIGNVTCISILQIKMLMIHIGCNNAQ